MARRFQFSLRTLLMGVTLLAMLCGSATWVVQDRRRLIRERDEALNRETAAKWVVTRRDDAIKDWTQAYHDSETTRLELEAKLRARTDAAPEK